MTAPGPHGRGGTPTPSIGSSEWINQQLEYVADLAKARSDEFTQDAEEHIEWLNEFMEGVREQVYERPFSNIAELMQTPRRLRQTPSRASTTGKKPLFQALDNIPDPPSPANNSPRFAREVQPPFRTQKPANSSPLKATETLGYSGAGLDEQEATTPTTDKGSLSFSSTPINLRDADHGEPRLAYSPIVEYDEPTRLSSPATCEVSRKKGSEGVSPSSTFSFASLPPREPLQKRSLSRQFRPSAPSERQSIVTAAEETGMEEAGAEQEQANGVEEKLNKKGSDEDEARREERLRTLLANGSLKIHEALNNLRAKSIGGELAKAPSEAKSPMAEAQPVRRSLRLSQSVSIPTKNSDSEKMAAGARHGASEHADEPARLPSANSRAPQSLESGYASDRQTPVREAAELVVPAEEPNGLVSTKDLKGKSAQKMKEDSTQAESGDSNGFTETKDTAHRTENIETRDSSHLTDNQDTTNTTRSDKLATVDTNRLAETAFESESDDDDWVPRIEAASSKTPQNTHAEAGSVPPEEAKTLAKFTTPGSRPGATAKPLMSVGSKTGNYTPGAVTAAIRAAKASTEYAVRIAQSAFSPRTQEKGASRPTHSNLTRLYPSSLNPESADTAELKQTTTTTSAAAAKAFEPITKPDAPKASPVARETPQSISGSAASKRLYPFGALRDTAKPTLSRNPSSRNVDRASPQKSAAKVTASSTNSNGNSGNSKLLNEPTKTGRLMSSIVSKDDENERKLQSAKRPPPEARRLDLSARKPNGPGGSPVRGQHHDLQSWQPKTKRIKPSASTKMVQSLTSASAAANASQSTASTTRLGPSESEAFASEIPQHRVVLESQKLASSKKTLIRVPSKQNLTKTGTATLHNSAFRASVKRAFDAGDEQQPSKEQPKQASKELQRSKQPGNVLRETKKANTGSNGDEKPLRPATKAGMSHLVHQSLNKNMPPSKASQSGVRLGMPQVDAVKYTSERIRFAPDQAKTETATAAQQAPPPPPAPAAAATGPTADELPEIDSEYSDEESDPEVAAAAAAAKAKDIPDWARSPQLREVLRRQQHINPDSIFGNMRPVQMEEIFRGRERALARFRPRSSSANWSGTDRLTENEIEGYARIMGFE